jgi:hypothetical protein
VRHTFRKAWRGFIEGDATFARRLTEMDQAPDRDARYRVNDFFCFDIAWKAVVSLLARGSDAVLVDLRGFGRQNSDCATRAFVSSRWSCPRCLGPLTHENPDGALGSGHLTVIRAGSASASTGLRLFIFFSIFGSASARRAQPFSPLCMRQPQSH